MQLVHANDFEAVKNIYIDVIENTPLIERYARWVYGKHPTDEQIKAYIERDEMSYLVGDCLFIGDSVPVKGDIPIFIDEQEIRKTLNILGTLGGIEAYYPAWDQTYDREMMKSKLADAMELIDMLKKTVLELDDGTDVETLTSQVCDRLNMQILKANPLFYRTLDCLR